MRNKNYKELKLQLEWKYNHEDTDWEELADLYKIAPLGDKKADELRKAFGNSMFKCFVYEKSQLIGVGRALADGVDCSYICDVAVHPQYQGTGIGKGIVKKLMSLSEGHKKLILYANPGKEGFYKKLGFKRMTTAMAIFEDQVSALERGLVDET